MSELEEIEKLLKSISETMDRMSQNQKEFDLDTCIQLEHLSYDTFKTANNIGDINQHYGVKNGLYN